MAWIKEKLGKISPWQWAWIVWVAIFFAIEIPASINKRPDDTLSEQVWALIGMQRREGPKNKAVQAARIGLIGFLAWLVVHFLTGGWA